MTPPSDAQADLTELEHLLTARRQASFYLSEYDRSQAVWSDRDKRYADVDAIMRGDWLQVDPASSSVVEFPKVPNVVQLACDDRAALASSVYPSLRCEPVSEDARTRAEKRERIAEHYRQANRFKELSPLLYMDLILCGVNFRYVGPDYSSGFPCVRRHDPRFVYPDRLLRPDDLPRSYIIAYQVPRAILENLYAEMEEAPKPDRNDSAATSDMVTVIEWADEKECFRLAKVPKPNTSDSLAIRLGPTFYHDLGRPPIVPAFRTTFDGQPHGVFDQVLGPLLADNRIFNLLVDGAADMIAAPAVEYDIENPEAWGSGEIMHARSPQGFIRRMQPDGASGTVFPILDQLRGGARTGAVYSEARTGEISQSIASAAFVSSIIGNLSTAVAQDQRIQAAADSEVLKLCFEVDEKFLSTTRSGERWQKLIRGTKKGSKFSESYSPIKDIDGDHNILVEYGGAAGADQFQYEIRLTQQQANKLVSRKTVMENLSSVTDVVENEKQLVREAILDAGLAFIQAAAANPQGPNFAPGAALLTALDSDEDTVFTVLRSFGQIQQGVAPGQAPPSSPSTPDPGSAFSQAASMQRGGLPAPQENVPGVGSLPGIEELGIPAL